MASREREGGGGRRVGWVQRLFETDPKLLFTAVVAVCGLGTAMIGQGQHEKSQTQADGRYTAAWVFAASQAATIDTLRREVRSIKLTLRRVRVSGSKLELIPPEPVPVYGPESPRGGLLRALRKLWPW